MNLKRQMALKAKPVLPYIQREHRVRRNDLWTDGTIEKKIQKAV